MTSVLVVESDSQVRQHVALTLRDMGHVVRETDTAGSALRDLRRHRPDLMICACSLPDLAGVDLLSDVRRSDDLRSLRIVMTSALDHSDDVAHALAQGADDFIGKPINDSELIARVNACLRRPAIHAETRPVSAGNITIDHIGRRVMAGGKMLSLAPREYQLIYFLINNQDRVYSRGQLLIQVWNRDAAVGPRTVDVHIRRLRSILAPSGCDRYLQTVRGSGYRFSLLS